MPDFLNFPHSKEIVHIFCCLTCFVFNDRNFLILPSSNLQLIKHAFTWFYHNGCFCIHPLGVLITDTFNSSEFETFSLGKVKSNWPSAWFRRKIHRLFSTFYMECMSVLIFILFIDYKQKLVYTAKHGKHWSVCLC